MEMSMKLDRMVLSSLCYKSNAHILQQECDDEKEMSRKERKSNKIKPKKLMRKWNELVNECRNFDACAA